MAQMIMSASGMIVPHIHILNIMKKNIIYLICCLFLVAGHAAAKKWTEYDDIGAGSIASTDTFMVFDQNPSAIQKQYKWSDLQTDLVSAGFSQLGSSISLTSEVTGTLPPGNGGTGVANAAGETITINGGYALQFTLSGATNVTLATSGTLADEVVYLSDCSGISNGFCIDTDDGKLYYYNNSAYRGVPVFDENGDLTISGDFQADSITAAQQATGGFIKIREGTGDTDFRGWKVPDTLTQSYTFELPNGDPTDNNIMLITSPTGTGESRYSAISYVKYSKNLSISLVDSLTDISTGTGIKAFTIPSDWNGMNLANVVCSVYSLGSGSPSSVNIQVRRRRANDDQDMLSTPVTIGLLEYYAQDGVVNGSYDDLNTGDNIYIDIDQVPSTAPKGLSCVLECEWP